MKSFKRKKGLTLKLKTVQENNVTKNIKQENIDPGKLQAGVSGMEILKNERIGMTCDKKDVTNISDCIQMQLGNDYDVKIPEKCFGK